MNPTQNGYSKLSCAECRNGAGLDFDFTMAFQPIVDLGNGRVFAQEALVRGANGEGAGSVLARINDANRYRFDQACRVKAVQLAAQLGIASHLSINFLPNAVYRPELCIRTTLEAAKTYGFPHNRIIFEVTEGEQITDHAHLLGIFQEYKRLGFLTAIDDFGAGYSGLNLLAEFQPNIIKLDMALICGIDSNRPRQAIVRGIVQVCVELGIRVIAEGIETAEELKPLRDFGITLFQGYHFARPQFEGLAPIVPEYGVSGV